MLTHMLARKVSPLVSIGLAVALALTVAGCDPAGPAPQGEQPADTKPAAVRIGVLPTEDVLPLWIADQKGYFKEAGLESVEFVVFQSAQERDTAFASGSVDMLMGDIIAAANLEAGGSKGTILTVMLGADQSQGRFAIVAGPKSKETSLATLSGPLKVGTSSATIQEYVLDKLVAEAGVGELVTKEEIKKVPVRYELLMQGKLAAAALPEPFVSLAEQNGAKVLADDTQAEENISQTVLFASDKYLADPAGTQAAWAVLEAWDRAVADINANPDSFRKVLVEQARLPRPIEQDYRVNAYPQSKVPAQKDVDAVLDWMRDKGYLKADVSYVDLTLVLPNRAE